MVDHLRDEDLIREMVLLPDGFVHYNNKNREGVGGHNFSYHAY